MGIQASELAPAKCVKKAFKCELICKKSIFVVHIRCRRGLFVDLTDYSQLHQDSQIFSYYILSFNTIWHTRVFKLPLFASEAHGTVSSGNAGSYESIQSF